MSKHTPGPWKPTYESDPYRLVDHTDGREIAAVSGVDNENRDANARLIAAAPDLLEALKGLLPMWESGVSEPWVEAAKAAIAKAEGEG